MVAAQDRLTRTMPYRDLPEQLLSRHEVVVAVYDAPHEAHLAALHLDTLGIPARLNNDILVGMAPHLAGAMGGVQVLVEEKDSAEAVTALDRLRRELAAERLARRLHERKHKRAIVGGSPKRHAWLTGALLICLALWLLIQLR